MSRNHALDCSRWTYSCQFVQNVQESWAFLDITIFASCICPKAIVLAWFERIFWTFSSHTPFLCPHNITVVLPSPFFQISNVFKFIFSFINLNLQVKVCLYFGLNIATTSLTPSSTNPHLLNTQSCKTASKGLIVLTKRVFIQIKRKFLRICPYSDLELGILLRQTMRRVSIISIMVIAILIVWNTIWQIGITLYFLESIFGKIRFRDMYIFCKAM